MHRAGASGSTISGILDQIVSSARAAGIVGPSRSVIGTIDIDSSDPMLERADTDVHALFEKSFGRPLVIRERTLRYGAGAKKGARPQRGKR